jgi:hypothetical protein
MSVVYADAPTECLQIVGEAAAGGLMDCVYWGATDHARREILYADAFHNDPAGPPCQWLFYDEIAGGWTPTADLLGLPAAIRRALYGAHFPGQLYINNLGGLRFRAPVGATAGSRITLNFVLRQQRGVF